MVELTSAHHDSADDGSSGGCLLSLQQLHDPEPQVCVAVYVCVCRIWVVVVVLLRCRSVLSMREVCSLGTTNTLRRRQPEGSNVHFNRCSPMTANSSLCSDQPVSAPRPPLVFRNTLPTDSLWASGALWDEGYSRRAMRTHPCRTLRASAPLS